MCCHLFDQRYAAPSSHLAGETVMKADTQLTVVMCCHLFDQRYAAPSSGDFWRRPSPPKACGLSWRNGFLLTLQKGLKCPFIKKLKKSNFIFFHHPEFYLLSSNSNSCFLSEKNMYKKFRPHFLVFLDHRLSFDQNKSQSLGKTDY